MKKPAEESPPSRKSKGLSSPTPIPSGSCERRAKGKGGEWVHGGGGVVAEKVGDRRSPYGSYVDGGVHDRGCPLLSSDVVWTDDLLPTLPSIFHPVSRVSILCRAKGRCPFYLCHRLGMIDGVSADRTRSMNYITWKRDY